MFQKSLYFLGFLSSYRFVCYGEDRQRERCSVCGDELGRHNNVRIPHLVVSARFFGGQAKATDDFLRWHLAIVTSAVDAAANILIGPDCSLLHH
jgi:hypothetical protein